MAFLGFIIIIVGAFCAGSLARDMNRSYLLWFLLSFVLTPLVTIPLLVFKGEKLPLTLHHMDRRRRIGFIVLGILILILYLNGPHGIH